MHLLLIGLRNVKQHRRRNLLLGGALALVTALLVVLFAGIQMTESGLFDMFTALFTGDVNVEGFYKPTPGRSQPAVTDYPAVLDLVRKNVPEATDVVVRGRGWARVMSTTANFQMGLIGVDIEGDRRLHQLLHPTSGRLEDLREPNTMLVFQSAADRLGISVGDDVMMIAPTLTGAYNSIDARVVAVAPDLGVLTKTQVVVSNATVQRLYGLNARTTGALQIYLRDPSTAPQVAERLRAVLAKAGYTLMDDDPRVWFEKLPKVNGQDWKGQRLDVTTYEAAMSMVTWFTTVMRVLAAALITLLTFVIAIGVMNTLWISIWERTREIGALRAIGMGRVSVMVMVTSEVLALTALATAIGAVVGSLLCFGVTQAHIPLPPDLASSLFQSRLTLHPDVLGAVVAVIGLTAFTTLMSTIPALKAARLQPLVAMQHTT